MILAILPATVHLTKISGIFLIQMHAVVKVMKAEVDQNVILRKVMENQISLTPPPTPTKKIIKK